jgi:DNA-binding MarR family transcriptional regulator
MNMFQTQRIRDLHKVEWQEEYIVGMISQIGPMNAMRILNLCTKQKIMSPATAHKYLKAASQKKLLTRKVSPVDKREVEYFASAKGSKFLDDVLAACKTKGNK